MITLKDNFPIQAVIKLTILKLLVGTFFASFFLRDLFIPFLNAFALDPTRNPWDFTYHGGIRNAFPYGPVMMYWMALPRMMFGWALPGDWQSVTFAHLALARVSLLVADILILWMIVKWLGASPRHAMLWWASPVVFYVTYVHGQLDLIPTAILLASLVFLVKGHHAWSAVMLGMGLATKSHLFAAAPFILVFAARREASWKRAFTFAGIALGTYVTILFPWVLNESFQRMVFGSEEQGRLFRVVLEYQPAVQVYLAPLVIGFLFFRFATYKKVNQDTLFMFLGLTFTVMISLLPPAHGYYIWPLPFVIYFFAQQADYSRVALWAFNVTCLAYLMLGLDSTVLESGQMVLPQLAGREPPLKFLESWGLDWSIANSLLFTAMGASILTLAFMMYRHGVQSNIIYRPKTRPVMVGIGGDSGSGKHTARDLLADILGPGTVLTVDGDDVHRWERGHEMWRVISHLNPEGNDLYLQLQYARALESGRVVTKVRYDHKSGMFTQPEEVSPNRFIFFVGLHPFYLKRMRDLTDIKIFMDTEEELRKKWKLRRDVPERGYTSEKVTEQLKERERDAALFIQPQKQFSDLIVRYYRVDAYDSGTDGDDSTLGVVIQMDNSLPLSRVVERLKRVPTLNVSHRHLHNLAYQELSIEGEIGSDEVREVAAETIPQLSELLGPQPCWRSNHNGIFQLCFLLLLSDLLLDRPDLVFS